MLFIFNLELEEEEAEERQRKLREEQYQKDRMTLEETRNQLRSLENHLAKCRDEKHQLFLQLKKVLHEESESRRAKAELRYYLNLHFNALFFLTLFQEVHI